MATLYEYTFTRHKVADYAYPVTITGPRTIAPVLQQMIGNAETERLVCVALNARMGIIGHEVAYMGSVNGATLRVAELFRMAVRVGASALIIAHNHPSGDPTPSPDDLHMTSETVAAGRLLDIPLRDHIILGDDDRWVSLRDRGVAFER